MKTPTEPTRAALRRRLAVGSLCAATLAGVLLSETGLGTAALAASTPAIGSCRLTVHVTAQRLAARNLGLTYRSSFGSASCTGRLGPWLMGGRAGWSRSTGVLPSTSRRGSCVPAPGSGHLLAVVPRFAWFHPPPVTLAGSFRLHDTGGVLRLAGTGRLVPTREAPAARTLRLVGTAQFTFDAGHGCTAKRISGTLTLAFAALTTV